VIQADIASGLLVQIMTVSLLYELVLRPVREKRFLVRSRPLDTETIAAKVDTKFVMDLAMSGKGRNKR